MGAVESMASVPESAFYYNVIARCGHVNIGLVWHVKNLIIDMHKVYR
jgi:hypothetical protein